MVWKQLAERNCREWKLLAIEPHDRHTCRSGERSALTGIISIKTGTSRLPVSHVFD